MQRATLILGLRQGVFTGRFILILYWQSAVLRIWSIRPEQGELNVIKRSKYHLQFCRFWLVCGTWQNILNSRQNRSKNKVSIVTKNTVTWVHGKYKLRVIGSCIDFFSLGDLNRATLYFLIKHIGGGEGVGKGSVYPEGDVLRSLVLTCLILFSLFESEDSRLALLSPASATSISFKAAQIPVSSYNVALLLRGDQYFRRDFTF